MELTRYTSLFLDFSILDCDHVFLRLARYIHIPYLPSLLIIYQPWLLFSVTTAIISFGLILPICYYINYQQKISLYNAVWYMIWVHIIYGLIYVVFFAMTHDNNKHVHVKKSKTIFKFELESSNEIHTQKTRNRPKNSQRRKKIGKEWCLWVPLMKIQSFFVFFFHLLFFYSKIQKKNPIPPFSHSSNSILILIGNFKTKFVWTVKEWMREN